MIMFFGNRKVLFFSSVDAQAIGFKLKSSKLKNPHHSGAFNSENVNWSFKHEKFE